MAYTQYTVENYASVIKICTDIIIKFPDYSMAHYFRSEAFLQLDSLDAALVDADEFLRDSSSTDAYEHRGYVLQTLGEYEKSIEDFRKAIQMDSSNFIAYYYQAVSHIFLKEYQSALNIFQHILPEDLEPYDSYFGMAICHYELGNTGAAREALYRAQLSLYFQFLDYDYLFEETSWYSEYPSLYDKYEFLTMNKHD
jgi:tetratricopeptide (TPR) repeat protein